MTGLETSSAATSVVKKAVGGFVAQKYLTVAAGLFGKNKNSDSGVKPRRGKKDVPPPTRLFNRKKSIVKKKDTTKPKAYQKEIVPAVANPKKSWTKTGAIVAATALAAIYVLYPTSLLLAFRVSENISWVRLFQHYHGCRMGEHVECAKVGGVQLLQLLSSVGSILYFYGISRGKYVKSIAQGILYYALVSMTAIAVMKFSVDELALWKAPAETDLQGKIAVITGANRGIGRATAGWMALNGAQVVLTCRSLSKCQPVVDEINEQVAATCISKHCGSAKAAVLDLSSLQSANELADTVSKDFPDGIHYLFCNAGTTPQHPLTKEGFEDGFGGMHLAHMAVALGLLPVLRTGAEKAQQDSRIVMVSSEMSINAAMGVFGPLEDMFNADNFRGEKIRGDGTLATSMPAYGRAKLCSVLLSLELNRQMKALEWPVVANAVHTGAVVTDSSRNSIKKTFEGIFPGLSWLVGNVYFPMLWRNVDGGTRTLLCAALSDQDFVTAGGQYLDALCRPFLPESTTDKDLAKEQIIPIPLGGGKSLQVSLDAVQALLLADSKYSKWLWDTSIDLLKDSPAGSTVDFDGKVGQGHDESAETEATKIKA